MAARKCPQCKDANDFHVNAGYDVSCGYCGFVVANIQDQFIASLSKVYVKPINKHVEEQDPRLSESDVQTQDDIDMFNAVECPNGCGYWKKDLLTNGCPECEADCHEVVIED